MVGGIIVGFARNGENTLVNVRDKTYGDTCALRIVEKRRDTSESIAIQVGDALWWQGDDALWTPFTMLGSDPGKGCGVTYDIRLPRIGFSH